MKNGIACCVCAIILLTNNCLSQVKSSSKPKFFISTGYGLAGSFFVRSYDEFAPFQKYKTFYKKNFVGVSQNAAIGASLNKNFGLRFGLNFQHFTRKIQTKDTLNNVIIEFDHTIHHRDYMWFANIDKKIESNNHAFAMGLGLYYLLPKQEEVEIYPTYVSNIERDQKNSKLNEGGSFIELAYEYKFQPRVNIGVKSQFYFTISTGAPESVTIFPYIKILF